MLGTQFTLNFLIEYHKSGQALHQKWQNQDHGEVTMGLNQYKVSTDFALLQNCRWPMTFNQWSVQHFPTLLCVLNWQVPIFSTKEKTCAHLLLNDVSLALDQASYFRFIPLKLLQLGTFGGRWLSWMVAARAWRAGKVKKKKPAFHFILPPVLRNDTRHVMFRLSRATFIFQKQVRQTVPLFNTNL